MAVVEVARPGGGVNGETRSGRGFRPEVQGLRALAVLMVVSYHVWFGRVSGGVDVFLLISAFLLALSFLRRVESGRPLELAKHWLHQFKRLLPAVVVVMLGILVATYVFVPRSRWSEILEQVWASLFYVQNWVLASNAVDYYAEDHSLASPLQHFWSLSVQGQVFILWPLLFLVSAFIARRFRLRFRVVVLVVFGALFVGSLVFSVWETYSNQAYAYFDTRARLWEFAFGTLLALALPFLRLPRSVRVVAGWVGVLAMLSGGFLLDVQGQFPGYVALWPLVAAALVIVAGQTGSAFGVDRWLSSKPLVRMGDVSYALYLWHWPVLVIYLIWRNQASPGILGGAAVIGLSLVLAYLTMRLVERPLRSLSWADKRRRRAVIVLATCLAIVVTPLTLWQQDLRLQAERAASQADVNNPGAIVLDPRFDVSAPDGVPLIPALSALKDEFQPTGERCSGTDIPSSDLIFDRCTVLLDPPDPDRRILVVGDSHAQQWSVPVVQLARERNWKLSFVLLGGCKFGLGAEGRTADCAEWNEAVARYVVEQQPDLVYTMGTAARPDNSQDVVVPGLGAAAELFDQHGIQVIVVRDNPRFEQNMVRCVEEEGRAASQCNPPRSASLNDMPPVEQLLAEAPAIHFLDLTESICTPAICSAVVGNIFVYLDDNHLTSAYLNSMMPTFVDKFDALVRF